eukprot:783409-Prorocentrum_minimum.AAC.2
MQWAFSGAGVWIPRDAYQQAAFAQPVPIAEARCGDLVGPYHPPGFVQHRENQLQEGRQYIPSVRTNRRRGGSKAKRSVRATLTYYRHQKSGLARFVTVRFKRTDGSRW